MSYSIIKHNDYFIIEFVGVTSLEENEQARLELVDKLNNEDINSVLVDMTHADLTGVTLEDLISFGASWKGLLVAETTKFATLIPDKHPFRDKIDLSHWVAVSHGVKLKIFEKKELAIDWLVSRDEPTAFSATR